jgi:hypothetical protein
MSAWVDSSNRTSGVSIIFGFRACHDTLHLPQTMLNQPQPGLETVETEVSLSMLG